MKEVKIIIVLAAITTIALLLQRCTQYAKNLDNEPTFECSIINNTSHKIDIYKYYVSENRELYYLVNRLKPYETFKVQYPKINCLYSLLLENADSVIVVFDDSIKIKHVYTLPRIASRPVLKLCYWNFSLINKKSYYSYEFNEQDYEEAKIK